MRSIVAAAVFTATFSVALSVQDAERSSGLCYHPRPRPRCHAFLLTNAGAYVTPTATDGETRFRGVVDWGFMVNSGPRNAVGVSWFVSLDKDDFTSGPVIRYRRSPGCCWPLPWQGVTNRSDLRSWPSAATATRKSPRSFAWPQKRRRIRRARFRPTRG